MSRRLLAVLLLGLLPGATGAGPWPGWRGPTGDGVAAEKGLPVRWSKDRGVRWKVALAGVDIAPHSTMRWRVPSVSTQP